MLTPYDVPADKLIPEIAKDLKEKVKLKRPEWTLFVKTSTHKERLPENEDWFWTRAASILRRIYIQRLVGVERLRTRYGGRKHRGRKPEEFHKGSGKIIRRILQEFDELGFTKKTKRGREITKKGISYLNKLSDKISKSELVK